MTSFWDSNICTSLAWVVPRSKWMMDSDVSRCKATVIKLDCYFNLWHGLQHVWTAGVFTQKEDKWFESLVPPLHIPTAGSENVQSGIIKLERGRDRKKLTQTSNRKRKGPVSRGGGGGGGGLSGREVQPTSESVLRRKRSPFPCPHTDTHHLCDVSAMKKKEKNTQGFNLL